MWRGVKINLVDTPGHADFGGEVERALTMVDGVLLLVDAAEGPLPQTRYVLSKAVAADLPAVVVINKVDRADARPEEVLDEVYQLFLDLEVPDHHIEFPCCRRSRARARPWSASACPAPTTTSHRCSTPSCARCRAPRRPLGPAPGARHQPRRLDYLGRLAIGRVMRGTLRAGRQVAVVKGGDDANVVRKPSKVLGIVGLGRVDVEEIVAGDVFVLAGLADVEIGDTIADPADPDPLPRLTVDEPVLRMTFGPEHLADLRQGGRLRHVPPHPGPPRPRGARQRRHQGRGHRVARHHPGRRSG
jgi:GTP-binding protein